MHCNTWNFHRAGLDDSIPDAELTIAVMAPALDPATARDCARLVTVSRNRDGRDTCSNG